MLEKHGKASIIGNIIDIYYRTSRQIFEIPSGVIKRGWLESPQNIAGRVFQQATFDDTEGVHLEGTDGGFNIRGMGLIPI